MWDSGGSLEAFGQLVASRVADRQRLAAVMSTGLLDTPAEDGFDRIAAIASRVLNTPFGFITVVDDRRSFWKACVGIDSLDSDERENRVEESFCQYVVGLDDAFMIDDTRLDERTRHNPSIETMGVLAWAGVPLKAPDGEVLGSVCVVDTRTREWTSGDAALLFDLAAIAADMIASTKTARMAARSEALLAAVLANAPIGFALVDEDLRYEIINETLAAINGVSVGDHLGRSISEVLPDVANGVEPILRQVLVTGEPVRGIEVTGSTPAYPGVERTWSSSYYRLTFDGETRAGLFVEEVSEQAKARRRATRLASITTALAKAVSFDEIEAILAHEIATYFEASIAVVSHWNNETRAVTLLADPEVRAAHSESLSFEHGPHGEAVRTGRIVTVSDSEDRLSRYGSRADVGLVAEAVVPCSSGGDSGFTAMMTIGWHHPVIVEAFPLAQLQTVGRLVAGTLERIRLNEQRRELIEALQQTLVSEPPRRPGLELAVRYRAASSALGFGGDWYDIIGLDRHRTALVVGDVAGHDPVAAARMSQIGSTVAQLLLANDDLTRLFGDVERSMVSRGINSMVTVGVVVVDPAHRTLTAVSAGHPPALLIEPDGTVQMLAQSLRPPLSRFFTASGEIRSVEYQPGSQLLLFSDGLIEVRGSDIFLDLERLALFLRGNRASSVEELVDGVLEKFSSKSDQFDDVALIAAALD